MPHRARRFFTPKDLPELPEQVRQAIDRHQARSERLVGWVQLAVVMLFAILYALSPKTFSPDAPFAPVPWVLCAYYLFTTLHLYYSHRTLPGPAFTYLSIIVDMALIYLLIWSFHLQYMQPPSFYMKAPTLLYVFIFIALRALRFEVRYILFAGFSAALGWLLMLGYALSGPEGMGAITKDYVEYLTSNRILLGAEFDKVASILVVTLVLAVAVHRARRLLLESVIEGRVAKGLAHFVPAEVLEQISSAQHQVQAGSATQYEATVMFTDIVNFTSISEPLPPQEVVLALNDYFTAVEEILERHAGEINQFQGDAILASFRNYNVDKRNARSPSPGSADTGHADRALLAALEIQEMLATRRFGNGLRLATRIGINTGIVVGGLMGSSHRLIHTVHGDEVNLAARLEQLNKEYGSTILLSENTRRAARSERFIFHPCGEARVKGRRQATPVYQIEINPRGAPSVPRDAAAPQSAG